MGCPLLKTIPNLCSHLRVSEHGVTTFHNKIFIHYKLWQICSVLLDCRAWWKPWAIKAGIKSNAFTCRGRNGALESQGTGATFEAWGQP